MWKSGQSLQIYKPRNHHKIKVISTQVVTENINHNLQLYYLLIAVCYWYRIGIDLNFHLTYLQTETQKKELKTSKKTNFKIEWKILYSLITSTYNDGKNWKITNSKFPTLQHYCKLEVLYEYT